MDSTESTFFIENTTQEFWALAEGLPDLPRDMQTAISLALPLEIYPVPDLRVSHVLAWAQRVNITHYIGGRNRRLHGCLLADRGKGTIFFDASDTPPEQRFTLAHELSHFLLDYQFPRRRAVGILGVSILVVLDGERPATREERLHAVLSGVPLGVMSHAMERPDDGLPANFIIAIEDRADRLALELLAPAQALYTMMQQAAPQGYAARLTFLTRLLTQEYGLPEIMASSYARYLLAQLGEPTFRDWLFDHA